MSLLDDRIIVKMKVLVEIDKLNNIEEDVQQIDTNEEGLVADVVVAVSGSIGKERNDNLKEESMEPREFLEKGCSSLVLVLLLELEVHVKVKVGNDLKEQKQQSKNSKEGTKEVVEI